MDRTLFYKQTTVNSTKELDYLYNSLSKFKSVAEYEPGYYRVVQEDIYRPDLISYKNYGTVAYWWLICYVNGVFDPFYDLEVGQEIEIPNILDIYTFYKKYRVR